MKKIFQCLGIVFLGIALGCARAEKMYYTAPSLLPDTRREMKTAGFWIARHPGPDKTVLQDQDIEKVNAQTREGLNLTKDVTDMPGWADGGPFRAELVRTLDELLWSGLYGRNGNKAGKTFFDPVKKNLALEKIPVTVEARFGLVVHYADQRLLPTEDGLFQKPGDIDFDELQNSALDIGTPVAILHESRDGKWQYVRTPLSDGWVMTQNVARCSRDELMGFLTGPRFIVVVSPKADIFLDGDRTEYYDYARMGTRLPFREQQGGDREIIVPIRDGDGRLVLKGGRMNEDEIHEGYLPFTARNVIRQAFRMLNAPYGWGGMYGEQDCSRFLQEVFATVGISLPRNSSAQGKVGELVAKFNVQTSNIDKIDVLRKKGVGGITILSLKGHILLYLGTVDGRPYAIHSVWAYREPGRGRDTPRLINRTAVTGLFLGEKSKNGSLLERLQVIRMIGKGALE